MSEIQPYEKQDGLAELDNEFDEEPGFNPIPVQIKIIHPSAMFEIPGIPSTDYLEGVVLSAMRVRTFFPNMDNKATTKEILNFTNKRPLCTSQDYVTGNLVNVDWETAVPESANILRAKLAEGGMDCVHCPFNQWESVGLLGKSGRGKACHDMRRLCLWKPGWSVPAILSLSPSSIKAWDGYCSSLVIGNMKPHYAVTRLSLEKRGEGAEGYSVVKIKFKEVITEEMRTELLSEVNLRGTKQSLAKALVDVFKRRQIAEEAYVEDEASPETASVDADDLGEDF